jgi:hypothetical protein
MDFAIFAVALNISKMHRKQVSKSKNPENSQKSARNPKFFVFWGIFITQTPPPPNSPPPPPQTRCLIIKKMSLF